MNGTAVSQETAFMIEANRKLSRRRYQELSRLCLYARTAALCGANCGESVRNTFDAEAEAKLILMMIK